MNRQQPQWVGFIGEIDTKPTERDMHGGDLARVGEDRFQFEQRGTISQERPHRSSLKAMAVVIPDLHQTFFMLDANNKGGLHLLDMRKQLLNGTSRLRLI